GQVERNQERLGDIPVGVDEEFEIVAFGIVRVDAPGDAVIGGEDAVAAGRGQALLDVAQVGKPAQLERDLVDAGPELRVGGVAGKLGGTTGGQHDLVVVERVAREKHQLHSAGMPAVGHGKAKYL